MLCVLIFTYIFHHRDSFGVFSVLCVWTFVCCWISWHFHKRCFSAGYFPSTQKSVGSQLTDVELGLCLLYFFNCFNFSPSLTKKKITSCLRGYERGRPFWIFQLVYNIVVLYFGLNYELQRQIKRMAVFTDMHIFSWKAKRFELDLAFYKTSVVATFVI